MKKIEGTHLLIDGYVDDANTLEQDIIFKLFDSLVGALDMVYLTRPTATDVPIHEELLDTDHDEGGTSYWAQITTSHIALHAWPLRKAFMMDIFSCKPFEPSKALMIVLNALGVKSHNSQFIQRTDPGNQ